MMSSLLNTIRNIDCKLLEITNSSLTQTLLYGNPSFDIITNSLILNATIDFILSTKTFEEALFYRNNQGLFFHLFLNNQSINPLFRLVNVTNIGYIGYIYPIYRIHLGYIFNTKYSSNIYLYLLFLKNILLY